MREGRREERIETERRKEDRREKWVNKIYKMKGRNMFKKSFY